jgi:hypothetical protein
MKKLTLLFPVIVLFALLTSHTNRKNDEGMFPLSDLKNLDLQKIGLKISPQELYNPNGTSLIDAIVRVGGCTGSFVSAEGLIVTNHHCAFGFAAAASTSANNYAKHGFLARNASEEIPAKGLVCKITASYADVSERVLQGTAQLTDPIARLRKIGENIKAVTRLENEANPDLQCEISEMFTGRTYVLFRYKLLKDVRLVYVPARSIGEYGGELDNWVWPRHSGDFAFLRAYVGKNGEATEYSQSNIPYKPAKFLKVNSRGVKENDFVFVLGYPGRTFRHQPAAFYKYHEQYMLKYISDIFDWQIHKMEELGAGSDSIQLRYASKIKSLANTTKNYKGKLQGFRRAGIVKQKEAEEAELTKFIMATEENRNKYGNLIPRVNEIYADVIKMAPKNLWLSQIYQISPSIGMASTFGIMQEQYALLKTKEEKATFVEQNKQKMQAAYARFCNAADPDFEMAAWRKMADDAATFNADNKIKWIDHLNLASKNNIEGYYMWLAKKSKLTRYKEIEELLKTNPAKVLERKDVMIDLVKDLNKEALAEEEQRSKRDGELNLLMAKYVDARSEWRKTQFIPDANSTLRFTYGFIKGYSPNDAEYHQPFTTLRGVIEKEDGKEYELLQAIKDLYAARDFGPFMHPQLNDLPVNILYNLDTTGGNSGSPVMNDKGELIAVNFDRAYTATINDYAWNESYSRSVAVDIRYVLWVLQKVARADYLIAEMGVTL